ncbi:MULTISPECIES: ATP-grasp domain-containing protein [unclassified Thioalkalivibrio]|uniref:ATP-grasp domain-containing protein n=2 Tax=unclassified Thioalkalivibrio TaxID=2621013 RepID=UPI0009DA68A5
MQDPEPTLVLAGHSVRSLAQSASASGLRVVAVDNYSDLDTREAAWRVLKVQGTIGETPEQLLLGTLGKPFESAMLIAGAGFEGKGGSLVELERRFHVVGNLPEVWNMVDTPDRFAKVLDDLDIPYPETRMDEPEQLDGWLFKTRSSCGGMGVYPAKKGISQSGCYRRYITGKPASVLFVADGHRAQILGYHHLLLTRMPGRPYLYAGAVAMQGVPASLESTVSHWVTALTARLGLRGFNGVDFMVNAAGRPWFLELNPRPTATMELHEPRLRRGGLVAYHLRACMGQLPKPLPVDSLTRGFRILFAKQEVRIGPVQWPGWSQDRPATGTLVGVGEPICSISGEGRSALETRTILAKRSRWLRAMLFAREPGVVEHRLEA